MTTKKKNALLQLEKLLCLQGLTLKRFENWLMKHLLHATEHLPDKEELILKVFKKCVILLFMIKRSLLFKKKIISTLEYPLKSKWTIFLDRLNTSEDPNILSMYLLKISVQELTSSAKGYQPFWTPAYKSVSEKLLLPIEIGSVGLPSTLLNVWSRKQEEKLQFLTVQKQSLENRNLPTTSYPSFMSSPVGEWEADSTPKLKLKTIKLKIYPTKEQARLLDGFMNTARYVYNRTVESIKGGCTVNFQRLRDSLVTENTRKLDENYIKKDKEIQELVSTINDENRHAVLKIVKQKQKELQEEMKTFQIKKNPLVKEFELQTPKDIRANSVQSACDAYKSGITNLKEGNIKSFNLKYKKKFVSSSVIELTPKNISLKNGKMKILPTIFRDSNILKMSKRNSKKHKKLSIEHNVDLVKTNGEYYVYVVTKAEGPKFPSTTAKTVCGVDPGCRTLATVYSHNREKTVVTEYTHRKEILIKLRNKFEKLRNSKKYCRKKQYRKIDDKKKNFIDSVHWNFINHLLKENDIIYFGDIKSHDIVKGGKNKKLNTDINDLKFFVLKQRLIYKASLIKDKKVFLLQESYTTRTCSSCGSINNNVGSSSCFMCPSCNLRTGRDWNASKNILMKGLLT